LEGYHNPAKLGQDFSTGSGHNLHAIKRILRTQAKEITKKRRRRRERRKKNQTASFAPLARPSLSSFLRGEKITVPKFIVLI
jgi:hypothetical protein